MFLRHINRVISNESRRSQLLHHKVRVAADQQLFSRMMASSSNESNELFEKWKLKFIEEKVPEVDSSLNNIMAHVLQLKRVGFCHAFPAFILMHLLWHTDGRVDHKEMEFVSSTTEAIRRALRMSFGSHASPVHNWRMGLSRFDTVYASTGVHSTARNRRIGRAHPATIRCQTTDAIPGSGLWQRCHQPCIAQITS